MIRLAAMIKRLLVTDTHTQTDSHMAAAYTALA